MAIHWLRITAVILLITFGMFMPYFPGDYDNLAPTLSFMAQFLCFAGLLLIPIGIAWLVYEAIQRTKPEKGPTNATYYIALVASAIVCISVLAVSITVFVSDNRSLGVITALLFAYFFIRLIPKLRQLKNSTTETVNPGPFYLVCIPLAAFLIRYAFIEQAVAYSRTRAIRQSEQLINDIETYHTHNGRYPLSMLSVWKDYKPSVVGIKQYHYEPNGKAYNLYFEQVSGDLATREIVMYNKLDEQVMTSHDQDLLLLTANELTQQRGYFAVHNVVDNLHWKRFLFD